VLALAAGKPLHVYVKIKRKTGTLRQWRNDRGAEGGSCPRAQQARGRKIGGAKVGFMQFVE